MPDMSIIKDMAHDLVHHAYDKVSGALSSPSAPNKPAASSEPASDWVSRLQKQAQTDRNAALDKQISDAGG